MKKIISVVLLLIVLQMQAQKAPTVTVSETYELSNIILALTDYGIEDKWEVQKNTDYYKEVMAYFEPVMNHPLLDSVNYSREKWEDYLSFRTDAFAFSFNKKGKIQRDYEFYAVEGHHPFDTHLALINDFVKKSGFRKFYADHKAFYEGIVNNYNTYNYLPEAIAFLDKLAGDTAKRKTIENYLVALSPLVYRMNCHREVKPSVEVDFPMVDKALMNDNISHEVSVDRLNSNHSIFTEKDHGYVNPVTDKLADLVSSSFHPEKWDTGSGYEGLSCFNEYMTWALYDLFLQENFPEYADEITMYWHFQNASRGFYASNLFAAKVRELYSRNKNQSLEDIYRGLLVWTKEVEETLSQPTLTNTNTNDFEVINIEKDGIILTFSESMDIVNPFSLKLGEVKDNKYTGEEEFITVKDGVWSDGNKTVQFKINTNYKEFSLVFNWWDINGPLVSKKSVYLKPNSYVLYRQYN